MSEALTIRIDGDVSQGLAAINEFYDTVEQGAAAASRKLRSHFSQPIQKQVELRFKDGKVVGVVTKVKDELSKVERVQKAVNGELGKTPAKLKEQARLIKVLIDNTKKFDTKTGEVTDEWKTLLAKLKLVNAEMGRFKIPDAGAKNVKNVESAFTSAGIKARLASEVIMMATRAISNGIKSMVERAREVQQLNVALGAFIKDQNTVNAIMEQAQNTAQVYGVSIQTVEKAWKRIGPAAGAAGLSVGKTDKLIRSATARIAQMGLNSEQSKRYMEALAQVMGKGKLQGEELTQQFAELDGSLKSQIAQSLAASEGITDLDDAMSKGQVSAKMFADALIDISDGALKRMANETKNVQDAWYGMNLEQKVNTMNNTFTVAAEKWGKVFEPLLDSGMRAATMIGGWIANFGDRYPLLMQAFENSMQEVGYVIELLVQGFTYFAEAIAMAMELALEYFGDFIPQLGKTGDLIQDVIIPGLKMFNPILAPIIDKAYEMYKAFGGAEINLEKSVIANRSLLGGITSTAQEAKKMVDDFERAYGNISSMSQAQLQLISQLERINEEVGDLNKKLEDAKKHQKEAKDLYDQQKAAVDELKASINARITDEMNAIKEKETAINSQIEQEKQRYAELKEQIKARYDEEKTAIQEVYNARIALLDAEISHLQKRGPAEQKLYEMRKEELQDKLKAGGLNEKQALQLQAQLERMERQEKIEERMAEKKRLQLAQAEALKALERERKEETEKAKQNHEKITEKLEKQKSDLEKQKQYWENIKRDVEKITRTHKAYVGDLKKGLDVLKDQVQKASDLKVQYEAAKMQVNFLTQALESATAQQSALNKAIASQPAAGGGAPPPKFAGGPVLGGSKYTVNELGKEAFLSASGHLSEINARAFGTWKAPSSGTVIPAHLASQLKIPSGGININKSAQANGAFASQGTPSSRLVQDIAAAMRGDTITNNVTIQSANTTQAASDMLVEMTKLRRRRYS